MFCLQSIVLFDRRRYLRHYSIIVCSCEWEFADTFSCHVLAEVKGLFLEIIIFLSETMTTEIMWKHCTLWNFVERPK